MTPIGQRIWKQPGMMRTMLTSAQPGTTALRIIMDHLRCGKKIARAQQRQQGEANPRSAQTYLRCRRQSLVKWKKTLSPSAPRASWTIAAMVHGAIPT